MQFTILTPASLVVDIIRLVASREVRAHGWLIFFTVRMMCIRFGYDTRPDCHTGCEDTCRTALRCVWHGFVSADTFCHAFMTCVS